MDVSTWKIVNRMEEIADRLFLLEDVVNKMNETINDLIKISEAQRTLFTILDKEIEFLKNKKTPV